VRDSPRRSSTAPEPALRGAPGLLAWLLPVVLLGATALGVGLALSRPRGLFMALLVALGCLPVVWILLSALWPAKAERRCPACGEECLVRLDERSTHGLGCTACGWRDESASAWLLAEEEGPLEELVLGERAARRTSVHSAPAPEHSPERAPPARSGAVDSSPPLG